MRAEQHRNEAFISIINDLPEKRLYIFNIIGRNPDITIQKISELTMKPINEISPRVTELKNSFLISETGYTENVYTRKKNTTHKVVENIEERKDLINAAYQMLVDKKSQLETDALRCNSKHTKELIRKEIQKIKSRITHLGKISIQNDVGKLL